MYTLKKVELMKTLATLFLLFFIVLASSAQDVIVKKNGDEVNAKVLEITTDAVKYKRTDNLEGPTISIYKNEVFMIKYANGTKETFQLNKIQNTTQPTYSASENEVQDAVKLAGPRIGFTILSGKLVDRMEENFSTSINPVITQFGWQFETRLFTTNSGISGLAEFVPLIGGLEQGKFLPSLSALVGLRGAKGMEFGVGPNVSLAGAGLIFALGTNIHSEGVNFPVNVALAPSKDGVRFSILVGFNSRKR